MDKPKHKRVVWGSRMGAVLAAAGCAVGLGNFLRFPGIAARNGGGAFMIPYFVAFLLLALPLCWMEWTMGRFGGRHHHGSAPGVFDVVSDRRHPWIKYLGVLGITGALGIFFFYVWVESWTLAYCVFAAIGRYAGITQPAEMGQFFHRYLGGMRPFSVDILPAYFFFLVTFACNFWVVWHGVNKGIERFCKIAMPLLFLLGIFLVVRVFTLGSPVNPEWTVERGLGFLWNPDFSALRSSRVWLEAAGQVFFTTSVGIGVLLTYASYMKSREDILLPSTTATVLNEFAEVILGGSIVIPAAFLFFGPAGTTQAVEGGTFGLAFRTTPLIFNQLTGGALIGCVWFLLLFVAGTTSSVSILQPAIAFLEEEFGYSRKRVICVVGAISFAAAHLAIFGEGVLDEMDFWFNSFGLPMFGFLETLVFVFFFGHDRGWEELHHGSPYRLPRFFKWIMIGVTPVFLFAILSLWFISEGWKTLLLIKITDGHVGPLYSSTQLPWVIATRLFAFSLVVGTCLLIRKAWRRREGSRGA